MNCNKCGRENGPEAKFCKQCGASLQVPVCPNCGKENKPDSQFCKFCGTSLHIQNCPKCGRENKLNSQFCKYCGQVLGVSKIIPTPPQATTPISQPASVVPPRQKRPFWIWGPTALAVLVTGSIIYPLIKQGRGAPTPAEPLTIPLSPTETTTLKPANSPTLSFSPTPIGGSGMIVFDSDKGGDKNIYIMDLGTQRITQLTDDSNYDGMPAWSPDGEQIIFVSNRNGDYDLFIMNADGSDQTLLLDGNNSIWQPSWSPDGKWIAYQKLQNGWDIFVLELATMEEYQCTTDNSYDEEPHFAPDNSYILFTSGRDGDPELYTTTCYNPGEEIQITHNDVNDSFGSISPDGSQIVFTSYRNEVSHLYLMNSDGSNEVDITPHDWSVAASWSPDGKKLAYLRNNQACIMTVQSPHTYCVPDSYTDTGYPSFRPSGSSNELASIDQLVESIPEESVCTDRAELINETIPDGSVFASAINFTKVWLIKNSGTCTWTTDYTFVFSAGEVMGADNSVSIPYYVEPGQSLELALDLVSPIPSGEYTSQWMLKNSSDETFGWGGQADQAFWLTIAVDQDKMAVPHPGNITLDESSIVPSDTSYHFSFSIPPGGEIPQPIDTDMDGLTDAWEETIANFFLPILYFDGGESAERDEIMRFYQVTPLSNNEVDLYNHPGYHFEEYQGPSGVLVTYQIAYAEDYSFPLDPLDIGSHHGDTETISILLVHPRSETNSLIPAVLMIHRHGNPAMYYWDEWWNPNRWSSDPNLVAAANESRFIHSGGHPIVWVAEDKHAMYATYEECVTEYTIIGEDCGNSWVLDDPIIEGVNGFNVGERANHPFTMVPDNRMGLFTNEWVWSSTESIVEYLQVYPPICQGCPPTTFPTTRDAADSFCGGSTWNQEGKCGGGLNRKWFPYANPEKRPVWGRLLTEYANIFYRMNYGSDYQVCFYTGDLSKSGTDLHVDVTFSGTVSSGTWYDLDNNDQNFEKGDVDCFDLSAPDFFETIRGLSLHLYNDSADDSEWYLEKVTVYEYDGGGTITYPVNMWIDRKAGTDSTIGEKTSGPNISLLPSP